MDVTRYWSRFPGNFVDSLTGKYVHDILPSGPKFTGSVKEWYETLVVTVVDCINDLQMETFAKYGRARRLAIDVYAHPDITCIFECSVLLKLLPDGATAPDGKSMPVGRITDFNVWADALLSNDSICVVAHFDTDDGVNKAMYGTVKILDIPENGRRT